MNEIKPEISTETRRVRGRALVLGPIRGVSERIAAELRELGIEAHLPGLSDDVLPSHGDPNSFDELRRIFTEFKQRYGLPFGPIFVHPGWSSWAERPEFPTLVEQCGLIPIAPPTRAIALFSNKLSLLVEAEKLGIPNLMIESTPMHSMREIEAFVQASRQRFPFILKAAKGGSRYGLTAIHETAELQEKLPLWLEQLRANSGEVILFAEKYLEGARCVSVSFARLPGARTRIFPMVDATLQCRHRKVIEFCPVEGLTPEIQKQIEKWTLEIAEACGYVGVGALEFLIESDRAFLIGGVPRLNASFHMWEKVAGTQAVAWQMAEHLGIEPEDFRQTQWGVAASLRFYAEDSIFQLPQPGIVHEVSDRKLWEYRMGMGELDLAVQAGDEITAEQQGWIGTLWVGAQNRQQALVLAHELCNEVWIAGSIQTNARFLSELLIHPWIREGVFHAGFIDEEFLPSLKPQAELIKLYASALMTPTDSANGTVERWAVGDQWVKPDASLIEWSQGPKVFRVETPSGSLQGLSGELTSSEGPLRFCAYPLAPGRWQVRLGSWVMVTRKVAAKSGEKPTPKISSLVGGRVHSILFQEGATVGAHEPLLMIESLGMFIPHALPVEVKIKKWKVKPEEKVYAGQDLAEFEILAKG